MDGLMFDTERLCFNVWKQVAGETGRELSEKTYTACIGRNSRDTRRIMQDEWGADFPCEEFLSRARKLMREEMERDGPPEKPGLRKLLGFLAEQKIPAAVATSSGRESALWMIGRAGLTGYFTAFAFGNEVEQGKPAPDIFLAALGRINEAFLNREPGGDRALLPEECIVLEDSPAGLLGASAAGMKPVFIKDLAEPQEEALSLVLASPQNLAEVIPLIQGLSEK
jgi:beta-phosphoglucomutase-like phosphatase (HAD superfamily)